MRWLAIERFQPPVNTFILVDADGALAAASPNPLHFPARSTPSQRRKAPRPLLVSRQSYKAAVRACTRATARYEL